MAPEPLVRSVTEAMREGNVMEALQACERDTGPLANIMTAGFRHVEDGFDVIQASIKSAADAEYEKVMPTLTWLSVIANIAPMLGLLGTVQGMIMAFQTISTSAMDVGILALAIAQALWTTAAGLCIAVPSIAAHYAFKNRANVMLLKMEDLTTGLIKGLRIVEVAAR
jgi:biopolymer transport protein ExbB